jgi:hypothetical protein
MICSVDLSALIHALVKIQSLENPAEMRDFLGTLIMQMIDELEKASNEELTR